MPLKPFTTVIDGVAPRQGGYRVLRLPTALVHGLPDGWRTRLLCTVDKAPPFRCGVLSDGRGGFFIILSQQRMRALGKAEGDAVRVRLAVDADPLGADMPPALEALLAQDGDARTRFAAMTPGGKRTVIHAMARVKDVDRQVRTAMQYIFGPRPRRGNDRP